MKYWHYLLPSGVVSWCFHVTQLKAFRYECSCCFFKTTVVITLNLAIISYSAKVKLSFPVCLVFVPVCWCFDSDFVFQVTCFAMKQLLTVVQFVPIGNISVSTNKLHDTSFIKKHVFFPVLSCLSSAHWCRHLFLRGYHLFSDGRTPSEAAESRGWCSTMCEARRSPSSRLKRSILDLYVGCTASPVLCSTCPPKPLPYSCGAEWSRLGYWSFGL